MRALSKVLVAALLASSLTGCFSSSPSCSDVASLNQKVNDLSTKDLNEDSMNDYVSARKDLETAEADCDDKGEDPQY